eukprot:TRINITY_DN22654_c0_g1_i4.p1 TRINITY_DN22654_c0_g1~~TRINITY_DN22654_c0_g1_i4.p1  ORF type:complete len:482 (-),score=62.87 TRINITY_DN22654_c0_g1_i4:510-1955(-)
MDEQVVQEFCRVTGSSREQAKFYLEASGGNFDIALDMCQEQRSVYNEMPSGSQMRPSSGFVQHQQNEFQRPQPNSSQDHPVQSNIPSGQQRNISNSLSQIWNLPGRLIAYIFRIFGQIIGFGSTTVFNLGRRVLPAPIVRRIRRHVQEISLQLGNHSSQEQARSFIQDFETRFSGCGQHPNFSELGPRETARVAHQQFRLLFVYIHSPEHEDTDRFVRESLCSNAVVNFVNRSMVCWGGSVHHADGFRLAGALGASTYPFCAVLAFSGSRLTLVTSVQGMVNSDTLLEALVQAVDMLEPRLVAERAEQQERELARRLRDEQDEAYQESLRLDQEKEQKAREERRKIEEQQTKQREEEERIRLESERKKQQEEELENRVNERRQQKRLILLPEPASNDPSTALIRIRLPDGSNQQRRFNENDKVGSVFDFVSSLDALQCWKYSLVSSYPRQVFDPEQQQQSSLREAGLSPQAVLFVQAEDDI